MEKEDKKLYSYKQALSQPTWIQKFNEEFSLPNPIKFSLLLYAGGIGLIVWVLTSIFLSFTAVGFRIMISVATGLWLGGIFSELVVDGKGMIFYLKDYLLFYFQFGIRADKIIVNKGQVYKKPKSIKKMKKG